MPGSSTNGPVAGTALRPGRLAPPACLRLRTIGLVLAVAVLVMTTAPAAQAAALHRAVKAGDLDGVTRMLAAGTDVNARDNRGRTALMYAVDKGYLLLVEPLLAAQADPNVRGPDGATALYIAAAHGHSEIIVMLMQAGADPTIKGPKRKGLKGRTPTDVARVHYGDTQTALKQGEPPAVVALLAGKTWAEEEAFVRKWAEWQPGKTFRDCAQCPEMVVVPAGSYMMGSPDGEEGRGHDEGPVHEVTIATPFAVGKYEVTFAEWDACVAAGGCKRRPDDMEWGRGRRPVNNVSWADAQTYVAWLAQETGQPYRLLSEAEWEYVARAETTGTYWWDGWFSTGADHAYANYGTDTCCEGKAAGADRWMHTSPVGSFEANAFGLVDTAGNVWEWVADCWNDSYRGAPSDGSAWTSGDCGSRVLRGGSWYNEPEVLRSANRGRSDTGSRDDTFGFRIARTLD